MKKFLALIYFVNLSVGLGQELEQLAPIPDSVSSTELEVDLELDASTSSPLMVSPELEEVLPFPVPQAISASSAEQAKEEAKEEVEEKGQELGPVEPSSCSLEGSYQGVDILFDDRAIEYDVEISRAAGDDSSLFMSIELSEQGSSSSSPAQSILVQLKKDAASGAYKYAGSPNFSDEDAVLGLSLSDIMDLNVIKCEGDQAEGLVFAKVKSSGLESSSILLNRKAEEDDSELGEEGSQDIQGSEQEGLEEDMSEGVFDEMLQDAGPISDPAPFYDELIKEQKESESSEQAGKSI